MYVSCNVMWKMQSSLQDTMLAVNISANHSQPKVSVCAKRGISSSHYMLINYLSQHNVVGKVVLLLQANKAATQATGV